MNLPAPFTEYTRALLGNEEYEKLSAALDQAPPVSIRLNPSFLTDANSPCQQGTVRPRQPSDEDSRLRSPSRGNPRVLHGESETFLDALEALQDFRSAQAAPFPFRSGESLDLRI